MEVVLFFLMLILDERSARLPFEMLNNNRRTGVRPWAVRQAMVRQFRTTQYRQNLKPVRVNSALVIGDPITELVEVPGARTEARAVAGELLHQGFDVRVMMQPVRADVRRALHAAPWRILHVAAKRFAEIFYQAFVNGETLGLSDFRARSACWAPFPPYNTWGAYQCYGDPDLRVA